MSSTSPSADDRASEGLLFDLPLAPEPAEAAGAGESSPGGEERGGDRPREGKGRGEARSAREESAPEAVAASGGEAGPESKAERGRRRKKGDRKRRVISTGDLPLFPEAAGGEDAAGEEEAEPVESAAGGASEDEAGRGSGRAEPTAAPAEAETATDSGERDDEREPRARRGVPLGRRFAAGGVDLGIHLALALAAVGGSFALGVRPALDVALPIGLFLLVFSFLYAVISLAFWGRTPGMAAAGLVARSDGEPLTFGQTALRWFAGLLTLATLGLPTLLALLGGRSLADRVSGSQTLAA